MARMLHKRPARKVVASSLGAALSTILLAILTQVFPDFPINGELRGAVTTVVVFLTGYITPPASEDQIVT